MSHEEKKKQRSFIFLFYFILKQCLKSQHEPVRPRSTRVERVCARSYEAILQAFFKLEATLLDLKYSFLPFIKALKLDEPGIMALCLLKLIIHT